jgi:hypothetical protein
MFFIELFLCAQSAQAMIIPRERTDAPRSIPTPLPQPASRLSMWSFVLLEAGSIRRGRTAADLLRQSDNER